MRAVKDAAGQPAISDPIIDEHRSTASHKWLIATAVMLGAFLQSLDMSIVNVALPYMQKSFNADVDQITWVVTSYLVAIGIMIPLTGWAATRFGRRRYLLSSVLLFVVTSALCGLARGIGQMVVFRFLQGAAGAAMMPLAQAILLETFPPAEHTLAMTTFGMGMMVAPVLGPTLGGWITMAWDWRWNFYINVPIGVAGALMVYGFVHDPHYLRQQRGSGRIDYLGIICVTIALGLLQIVLSRGGRSGWFAAAWVRYFTAISLGATVLLIFHELRFPAPVVDLRLLKIFGFTLSIVLISLQALAIFSVNLLNPLFMENLLGYDAWKTGIAVSPRGLGVIIALVVVGQLSRRNLDMRPVIAAGFVVGAWEVWRMSQWGLDVSMREVLWPIFMFGLGLGAVFPTATAYGIGQVQRERMGFAASLFSMMINIGAAVGIASVTNMLTSRQLDHYTTLMRIFTHAGYPLPTVEHLITPDSWLLAYHDVYRLIAWLVLMLAPLCFFLKRPAGTATNTVIE